MTESEAIREVRFNMSTIGLSDKAAKRVVEELEENASRYTKSDCKKKAHNEAMRKGLKPILDDNIKFCITVA